jgi:hypothetical protein
MVSTRRSQNDNTDGNKLHSYSVGDKVEVSKALQSLGAVLFRIHYNCYSQLYLVFLLVV